MLDTWVSGHEYAQHPNTFGSIDSQPKGANPEKISWGAETPGNDTMGWRWNTLN